MTDQLKHNKLAGTRVLVLGGTSGIGFGVASACIESGVSHLVVSSSNPERVNKAIERLQEAYPTLSKRCTIAGRTCDLGSIATMEASIAALLEFATDNGNHKLDHVIFTAGSPLSSKPFQELSAQDAVDKGTVRFFGTTMVAKHAIKYMNPGPRSSFTMTSGSVAERPHPNWHITAGYAAGQAGLMRALALDYKPLRFNLIIPGAVDTELWDGLPAQSRQGLINSLAKVMPTGQVGRVEDVAEAYLYAMKDINLTGSTISTNGGILLAGPQVSI